MQPAIIGIITLIIGVVIGFMVNRYLTQKEQIKQKMTAEDIISGAKEQARLIEIQARDDALELTRKTEKEIAQRRKELIQDENRIQNRRDEQDRRAEKLEKREQMVNNRQSAVDRRANEVDKQYEIQMKKLQEISQMTTEEAKEIVLAEVEKDARGDMARIVRQIEAEAKADGEKRARKLVADAIQRVASEHVSEVTSRLVPLPNDDMKGRIVGRNGRNIKAFEKAAGVDVIVDDTPESVTISCFDSVRREVGRRAMTRLTLDGRIHPAHIEKIVKQETKAVDKVMAEAGEQAAYDAGISGLKPEVLRMMGRLKFRTSYGQNQLAHAVESSKLASIIAAELGADIEVAKLGGFLHDIGKAMDHNQEGTHAQLGAEFCKRYGVRNEKVLNAIASHHHEEEQASVEAVIVEAADAISGARPGARREDLDAYIKRIRALEDLAKSFKGVEQAYAIQAGREVRIIVRPDDIDDFTAGKLARDIANQIEENMQYPGQIKVIVIRETRAIDYAK
ncbi:MAG TPA: ribonuclease Y [Anaerolineales bacterium]|nr:ribonuclease Y [Anaerolineales bacterium]